VTNVTSATDYDLICPLITENSTQDQNFIGIIEQLPKNILHKVTLIHDTQTRFPTVRDIQQPIFKSLFDRIALTLVPGQEERLWKRLIEYSQYPLIDNEDISTNMFISYVQSTGQAKAQNLFLLLNKNSHKKRIFLDVQAKFRLHDLNRIVENTNLFIMIYTPGIYNSYYCKQGMFKSNVIAYI
jgi:hypothetical protein